MKQTPPFVFEYRGNWTQPLKLGLGHVCEHPTLWPAVPDFAVGLLHMGGTMGTTKIKIDTHKLGKCSNDMFAGLLAVRQLIKEIEEDFERLETMWTGEASEAYRLEVQEAMADLKDACSELEAFVEFEVSAKQEYLKRAGLADAVIKAAYVLE